MYQRPNFRGYFIKWIITMHIANGLRDKMVRRWISLKGRCSRKCIRLIFAYMTLIITSVDLRLKIKLDTWIIWLKIHQHNYRLASYLNQRLQPSFGTLFGDIKLLKCLIGCQSIRRLWNSVWNMRKIAGSIFINGRFNSNVSIPLIWSSCPLFDIREETCNCFATLLSVFFS